MTLPAETSVLIIGAGPVGLTLANLLGAEGAATVLVERNPGCVPEPRAVALDGESLRTLQAAGLADTVLADIRQGFVADYINGEGVRLFSTDLTAHPYGFCLQNTFDQPTLERQLLSGGCGRQWRRRCTTRAQGARRRWQLLSDPIGRG